MATSQLSSPAGAIYVIDFSSANAENLPAAIAPYVNAGRRTGRKTGKKSGGTGGNAKEIRAWALENGLEVPARGRIPGLVRDAYDAAH